MVAKVSALLAAVGAAAVVLGSLGPWLVVASPAARLEVGVQEGGGDRRLGLGLLALAVVAIVVAARRRRGATWLASLLCVGIVAYHGGLDDRRVALWFGLFALVAVGLAAGGVRGVAWLAVPFCLGSALVVGYAWWQIRRRLDRLGWLDVPDVLDPLLPDLGGDLIRAGWGLYAVVIGGALGGAMATVLALTDRGPDRSGRDDASVGDSTAGLRPDGPRPR